MSKTIYPGIDYGMGRSNIDLENGIRYGVISQNSVMPEAVDDIITQGKDLAWEAAINQGRNELGEDFDEDAYTEKLGMHWESSLNNYLYEKDGYKITGCLDNDLMILKSSYFTYAQFCSPCVPGACNLDSPFDFAISQSDNAKDYITAARSNNFLRCYCLGPDWFEDDPPYPIFRVDNEELVTKLNT